MTMTKNAEADCEHCLFNDAAHSTECHRRWMKHYPDCCLQGVFEDEKDNIYEIIEEHQEFMRKLMITQSCSICELRIEDMGSCIIKIGAGFVFYYHPDCYPVTKKEKVKKNNDKIL